MRNLRCLQLLFAAIFLACTMTLNAGTLIDVAFTTNSVTSKRGFAATGVVSSDFWNTCTSTIYAPFYLTTGVVPNLKFVDQTTSYAGLTAIYQAWGRCGLYQNGSSDPMYGTYLYDGLGSITMTITNLSAGSYSFYLYGHGNADNQNSVFQLTAGSQGYGTEATINGSGWLSSVWQEGVQYVEFTNVNVAPGQTITIAVEPGANNNAVISGLQIASTPVPFIVSQPAAYEQVAQGAAATFSVTAGGTAPLAYQWLFDGTNISAATNSSYSVTNAQCANAGNYSVIVTNAFGIVTSIVAELNVIVPPVAPFTKVIDVDFTGVSVTSEIGIAATGVTTSDFWNTYNLSSGTLTNLKFMDGTASGAGLTVANVQSEYGNGAPDPMYGSYLYNQGGNMTVTITDLDAGAYDFYIYGHGSGNNQDGIYQLTVGWQSYGTEATINGPGWLSSVWQEGAQYVEFTNVNVAPGQTITITVESGQSTGGSIYALIGGLQMALSSSAFIVTQPANQQVVQGASATFEVVAGGASPLAYQWLFNDANISGATNSSYIVTNAQLANAGNYSVIVSNAYGSMTSFPAVLEMGPLINGGFEDPPITNGSERLVNPGDSWLTGWTTGGPGNGLFVETGSDGGLNAVDGEHWVGFDAQLAPPDCSLSQTFSTIAGETYLLTYSVAPCWQSGLLKGLQAEVLASDSSLLASKEIAWVGLYWNTWSTVRLTFSALTPNTTLIFTDISAPYMGLSVGLDAVSVVALPTNSPPLVISSSNRFVEANQGVIVTNYAYSANGPISFTLASNAPAGASITTNGVFKWAPTCEQGSTTNLITVWVTDSSTPPLSNSMTFSVIVGSCVEVSVASSIVQAGQSACLPLNLVATVGLTNLSFTVAYPSGFLTNWNVSPGNSVIASATANTVDASHTQFTFGVRQGQVLQGASDIASICFDTLPGTSAFVPLAVAGIVATVSNNSPVTNLIDQGGRVVLISSKSLLELSPGTNSSRTLTLYGNPGVSYDLLSTTNLIQSSPWSMVESVTLTNLFQVINLGKATNQMQFFKAVQP